MPSNPRRKKWSAKLTRPLALRDGTLLRTLADASTMILERVPADEQFPRAWQSAAGLLMAAAESVAGDDIEAATRQVELALFLSARLRLR